MIKRILFFLKHTSFFITVNHTISTVTDEAFVPECTHLKQVKKPYNNLQPFIESDKNSCLLSTNIIENIPFKNDILQAAYVRMIFEYYNSKSRKNNCNF